jgi:hypothetical protein
MHGNKRLAIIFVRANPEGDVPWNRRQLICRAVKINCAAMTIALPQTKDEMLLVHDSRRRDWRHITRQKNRLPISISERLQHFMPVQEIDVDFVEPKLVIQMEAALLRLFGKQLARSVTKLFGKRAEFFLA